MSPEKISTEIARINQDISGLMDLIKDERRPEQKQRYQNTIELKKKELIRLEEKRQGAKY